MADKEKAESKKILDWKTFRRLFDFIGAYKKYFYLLIFLTVLTAVFGPSRPLLIQFAVDNYIVTGDYPGLVNISILMVVILTFEAFLMYAHTYLSNWLGQTVIKDIRVQLYQHILRLRLKFYDNTPIGRLVTRNVSDIETLSNVFSQGIASLLADVLLIFAILGVMFYTHWQLTLVSLSLLPLLLLSTYIFKEKIKVAFDQVRAAVSNLNSFVQEHITGMSVVQIFGSEANESKKFKEINREHRKAHLKSVLYYSIYFPVAEIISAGGTGLLVWYGARGVLHEEVSLGVLIAFIMYINLFFRPIRMLADRFNTLQMGIVSMHRILTLLDDKDHIPNEGDYAPEHIKGDISFDKVWFAYKDEDYVLKNISFEVKEGETVALVGATGAGKSSIINLLSRFYEINKGTILLDGHDVNDYDLAHLRTKIGVVLQDVFLFSNSIKENIVLGNTHITRDQLLTSAELVGARRFIEKLPEGFEYNVMERGSTLSVGQRQLISFVRAMVYDPKIIVLDEATSSVDTETEELIQSAIEKLMKGRTSIVIAHRLSTIQKADKIIVLDKGEIKEQGTHTELLAKNGWYAQLHKMQYKEVAE
ncbi:ABC transporter ATP-binding protein [Microscilla marina]|uniref:ATPase n=1 Tax=Microscilla marina ATCC 23134 TaxID=313606 RepID=A1ZTP4_MICM2|nr:ABC transporter ATP-binding protein [Microscilla marina]EAY26304.1 ATPase [Microscilla marina ATCC 23134]